MRKTILRTVAVAAWLLALSPIPSSLGQDDTVTLVQYGWWNANQTLPSDPTGGLLPPLEVPPPPEAPEDGLYVEAGANDTALAIAAVLFYTGGGVDSTLTLDIAGDGSTDGVTLAACPAAAGWDADQNGRWDKRPVYDPATCTYLGDSAGTTVTFTVPAAAHQPGSAYLSLAIVPAAGSGPFSAGFAPPTSGSLATSSPPSPSGEPASDPAPSGPVYDPGSATVGDPSFTPPAPADPVEVPTASPVAGEEGSSAPPTSIVAAPPLVVEDTDRSTQVIAAVTLTLIGVALWWLSSRPQRAPRLLGSMSVEGAPAPAVAAPAGGPPRGLGRFVRARSVPPTPI